MATNLDLDDKLIQQAVKIGGHRTKREAVNAALGEYIRSIHRKVAIEAMGREDPGEVEDVPRRTHFDHASLRRGAKPTRAASRSSVKRAKRKSA